MGSGERAADSICASFVTTAAGDVMSNPEVSSLRIKSSVGSLVEALAPVADQRMDLSAALGLFTNIKRRGLPSLRRRRWWACQIRRRVALQSLLKQA